MNKNQTILAISLLAITGITAPANAQVTDTGETLRVDQNAFYLETGDRTNTSNIPLPTILPENLIEKQALPVSDTLLAPNSVNVGTNDSYIVNSVREATGYSVTDYVVELNVEIDLVPGAHKYGEGIELTGGDGTTESAFVQGSGVTVGPNGEQLANSNQLSTTFNRGEEATIGFRNIRENGGPIEQSGVHFDASGNLITEDLQDGGDLDFNDGQYITNLSASAIADIEDVQSVEQTTSRTEDFELVSRSAIDLLGFMNENGTYTDATRFYAESDGNSGVTHQFTPLFNNRRPTLLNVGVRTDFDSVAASLGINQFITPVYRIEESEVLSDYIVLQPTELSTGNYDAAYDNTGGVIVEYTDGSHQFLAQWTVDSRYEQETYFSADEVVSFTSALIPEQQGTDQLKAGTMYELTYNNGVYSLGNLVVIAENIHPENFSPVTATLSGVEDTLAGQNYILDEYDGIRYDGTVDHNDAFVSLEYDRPIETVETVIPNRFGIYIGASGEIGLGNETTYTTVRRTDTTTTGQAYLFIDSEGYVNVNGIETVESTETYVVSSDSSTNVVFSDMNYDVAVGAIYAYGGTPYTETADQISLEAYTGSQDGIRAEIKDNFIGLPLYLRADHQFRNDTEITLGASFSF